MLKLIGLYRVLAIVKNNTLVKRLNISENDLIEVSMNLKNNATYKKSYARYVTVTNLTNNLKTENVSLNVLANMIYSGLNLIQE